MRRIGVFDSGVGGLSVTKELINARVFEQIIYYGDTARVPYGVKDQNTIIRYALEAVEFFKNFEIDLLIVACNTVSAYALDEMRAQSNFKILGVVEPGVEAVVSTDISLDAQILVLATHATITSGAYQSALQHRGYSNIAAKTTGLFVPIVEEGLYSGAILDATIEHYLSACKQPDAIILGCTHFPLIKDQISRYFNNKSLIIHSGEAISMQLLEEFGEIDKNLKTEIKLFASQNPEALKQTAKDWLT